MPDRIGGEQVDLDRIEPAALVSQGSLDDRACRRPHRERNLSAGRRHLHQRRRGLAIAHDMHEAAHGIGLAGIVGDPGASPSRRTSLVRPAVADQRRTPAWPKANDVSARWLPTTTALRAIRRRSQRIGRIHDEDRIVVAHRPEPRSQACGITLRHRPRRECRPGLACDHLSGRTLSRLSDVLRNSGEFSAEIDQPIHRQNTNSAAVGDDCQAMAMRMIADAAQRFGSQRTIREIEHPQDAGRGGTRRRRRHPIRPARRYGSQPLARLAQWRPDLMTTTGFTRASARRGHEFANVADRFDIKQDRPCLAIQREIIQQITEIDIELVADGDNSGKAHRALRRPIDHPGGNGAGLGDQRQTSRARHVCGEAGIEAGTRHHDAKTIGPYQSHSILVGCAFDRFRKRSRTMAKPRGDNQCARRTQPSCFIDQPRDGRHRSGNHHEFRHKRQFTQTADATNAIDLGIAWIHEPKFTWEFRFSNIFENSTPDRCPPRTGPDQRDRTGRKHILQTIS